MRKIKLHQIGEKGSGVYATLDNRFRISRKHGLPATWWLIEDMKGTLPKSLCSADTLAEAKENVADWLEDENVG